MFAAGVDVAAGGFLSGGIPDGCRSGPCPRFARRARSYRVAAT
ncbi:hypothetical protein PCLA_08f0159 [Pseudomonas citronellolis]|nr:hypothetical protein PCLA_08f0159 [Pseudomonas citronellolis]